MPMTRTGSRMPPNSRKNSPVPTRKSKVPGNDTTVDARGRGNCPTSRRNMPMPTLSPDALYQTGHALFVAAGAAAEEAHIVMEHLVGANLAGHDSHGIILLPTYIARIKRGHIVPGAPFVIER